METRSKTRLRLSAAPQQPVNEASRQQNMHNKRRQTETSSARPRGRPPRVARQVQGSESSQGSKEKTESRERSMEADAFNTFKAVPNQQFFDQWCECPICFEVPLGRVANCANGHTFCKNCRDKLNSCPLCGDRSTFRNLLMEGIISNSTLNCPHRTQGCTCEILGSRMSEHLRGCQFRPSMYVKEEPDPVVRFLVLFVLTVVAVFVMTMTY